MFVCVLMVFFTYFYYDVTSLSLTKQALGVRVFSKKKNGTRDRKWPMSTRRAKTNTKNIT